MLVLRFVEVPLCQHSASSSLVFGLSLASELPKGEDNFSLTGDIQSILN